MLEDLNASTDDFKLSPSLASLVVCICLDGVSLHLKHAKLYPGPCDASTKLFTDQITLAHLIQHKNKEAFLEAFMAGKIRIEGDMSPILTLQNTNPSAELKGYYKRLFAKTAFAV